MDHSAVGSPRSLESENDRSGILASSFAAGEKQLRENQGFAVGAIQSCLPLRTVRPQSHSSGSSGGKRRAAPSVLTPTEIRALLGGLNLRERTLVLLAASTGLRQSELFGVKWCDIDFAQHTMNVVRSIVYGVVGPCKTESSQKPVPVHPTVLEALGKWRQLCRYNKSDDWVFASRRYRGRKPIWGQAILRKYIRPAAQRVGIQKRFGWHTFRHTYSTLLRSVGTEFKVMQELLRHSTLRSTLDVYTQAITCETCSSGSGLVVGVFVRSERNVTAVCIGWRCGVRTTDGNCPGRKWTQKRAQDRALLGPRWFGQN